MKKTTLVLVMAISLANAYGQKLPKIQTTSVRAPQNIKIDGKITEWNDQFQAHNTGNHIYYTVSNDDSNLYLTVRMEDLLGSRKIFKGGLSFSILPSSKTADKLMITFPAIGKAIMDTEERGGTPLLRYRALTKAKPTATNKAKIDSLISSANKAIGKTYKQIYITGMPGITDSLLSIYNTQEITVGAGFDKSMNYTYELAVPLKYLQAAISDVKSLKYNIKLHTISPIQMKIALSKPPTVLTVVGSFQPGSMDDMFFYEDTDFSGEYTLAK